MEQKMTTLPTDRDIALEIVTRFLRNPHPQQKANYEREKKAFADGAIWIREKSQYLQASLTESEAEKGRLLELPKLIEEWSNKTPQEMQADFGKTDFEFWAEVLVPLADKLLKGEG